MNKISSLSRVLMLVSLMAICLFGFSVINYDKISTELGSGVSPIYCGTSNMAGVYSDTLLDGQAERGRLLFNSNCKSCHRMDMKLVGPALRGVFERRDSLWIKRMIINAEKLRRQGDRQAIAVYKEYHKMTHTTFESFSQKELNDLMIYLKTDPKPVYWN